MKKDNNERQVLNLTEAARFLGRSRLLVTELVDAGILPCRIISNGEDRRRTFFFSRKALEDWLKGKDEE